VDSINGGWGGGGGGASTQPLFHRIRKPVKLEGK
jgi:hypothetical protein